MRVVRVIISYMRHCGCIRTTARITRSGGPPSFGNTAHWPTSCSLRPLQHEQQRARLWWSTLQHLREHLLASHPRHRCRPRGLQLWHLRVPLGSAPSLLLLAGDDGCVSLFRTVFHVKWWDISIFLIHVFSTFTRTKRWHDQKVGMKKGTFNSTFD